MTSPFPRPITVVFFDYSRATGTLRSEPQQIRFAWSRQSIFFAHHSLEEKVLVFNLSRHPAIAF